MARVGGIKALAVHPVVPSFSSRCLFFHASSKIVRRVGINLTNHHMDHERAARLVDRGEGHILAWASGKWVVSVD